MDSSQMVRVANVHTCGWDCEHTPRHQHTVPRTIHHEPKSVGFSHEQKGMCVHNVDTFVTRLPHICGKQIKYLPSAHCI